MLQTQQLKRAHRVALSTVLLLRDVASGLTTKTIRRAGSRPQILKRKNWLMPFLEIVPVDFPNNLSSVIDFFIKFLRIHPNIFLLSFINCFFSGSASDGEGEEEGGEEDGEDGDGESIGGQFLLVNS